MQERYLHSHTTVYKDGSHSRGYVEKLPIEQEGKKPMFWFYISSGNSYSYGDSWLQLTVKNGTTVGDLERVVENLDVDRFVRNVFYQCIKNKRFLSGSYELKF